MYFMFSIALAKNKQARKWLVEHLVTEYKDAIGCGAYNQRSYNPMGKGKL